MITEKQLADVTNDRDRLARGLRDLRDTMRSHIAGGVADLQTVDRAVRDIDLLLDGSRR